LIWSVQAIPVGQAVVAAAAGAADKPLTFFQRQRQHRIRSPSLPLNNDRQGFIGRLSDQIQRRWLRL